MRSVELIARPKVNLFLHVTGKRPDGYHLLDSLAVFPSGLGDTLDISLSHRIFSLRILGKFKDDVPDDEDRKNNLLMKAWSSFPTELQPWLSDYESTLAIALQKDIPVGAGLGGGSADAAAMIKGLEQLSGHRLEKAQRDAILLSLGADVPACYDSVPCRFQGIGEIITPVKEIPAMHIILAWPGVPSLTKNVFESWDPVYRKPLATIPDFEGIDDFIEFLEGTENVLTSAAEKNCPIITHALQIMEAQKGCRLSRMTGSGSCVFGLFEDEKSSYDASSAIGADNPTWWVRTGRI